MVTVTFAVLPRVTTISAPAAVGADATVTDAIVIAAAVLKLHVYAEAGGRPVADCAVVATVAVYVVPPRQRGGWLELHPVARPGEGPGDRRRPRLRYRPVATLNRNGREREGALRDGLVHGHVEGDGDGCCHALLPSRRCGKDCADRRPFLCLESPTEGPAIFRPATEQAE